MSFLVEALKDTVARAEARDAEGVQSSARLDDKAQKTITLAGLFLAAAFGFLKPDSTGSLFSSFGIYAGIMVVFTIVVFLVCLALCLSVMWVRAVPSPVGLSIMDEMNRDLILLPRGELTDEVQQNYYRDLLKLWIPTLEKQRTINKGKARRLLIAQVFLSFGMLSVAALLFLLVFNAVTVIPKL